MTAITMVAVNISADWDRGAETFADNKSGVALTVGQWVYLDASNLWQLAVADIALLNATVVGQVTGAPNQYGETTIPSGDYPAVTVAGPVWGYSGLNSGQFLYLSKTVPGGADTAAPTGGAYQYVLGHAIGPDTFYVQPGQTQPVSA